MGRMSWVGTGELEGGGFGVLFKGYGLETIHQSIELFVCRLYNIYNDRGAVRYNFG